MSIRDRDRRRDATVAHNDSYIGCTATLLWSVSRHPGYLLIQMCIRDREEIAKECPWATIGRPTNRPVNIMTSLELKPEVMEAVSYTHLL